VKTPLQNELIPTIVQTPLQNELIPTIVQTPLQNGLIPTIEPIFKEFDIESSWRNEDNDNNNYKI